MNPYEEAQRKLSLHGVILRHIPDGFSIMRRGETVDQALFCATLDAAVDEGMQLEISVARTRRRRRPMSAKGQRRAWFKAQRKRAWARLRGSL